MDCDSIYVAGSSNFSSSSPHRMPTVSAAQALQDLKYSPARCISTSLSHLDCMLQNGRPELLDGQTPYGGGVSRGKVTEIYGPPGVGKTAIGMQLAASALRSGDGVIWVDASHPLPGFRLSQILSSIQMSFSSSPPEPEPEILPTLLANLSHFSTPTLSHFLALVSHLSSHQLPSRASILIVDSFSTIISAAFPRAIGRAPNPKSSNRPNSSSRKIPILQHLITTLQKLALTRDVAIVILSQCVSKMRPGPGAVLIPAINATVWEQGLGCRIVLFRDWGWEGKEEDGKLRRVGDMRLAQVLRAEGVALSESPRRLVAFTVLETGLTPLTFPAQYPKQNEDFSSPRLLHHLPLLARNISIPQKRKAVNLEIPDSEGEDDEDYGWAEEDDEELPPPPPQWQGSEDILVRREQLDDMQDGMNEGLLDAVHDSEDELAL